MSKKINKASGFNRYPYGRFETPTFYDRLRRAEERIAELEFDLKVETKCHRDALEQHNKAQKSLRIADAEIDLQLRRNEALHSTNVTLRLEIAASRNNDLITDHVRISREEYLRLKNRREIRPEEAVVVRAHYNRIRAASQRLDQIKAALR